jgi:hypothetical protein
MQPQKRAPQAVLPVLTRLLTACVPVDVHYFRLREPQSQRLIIELSGLDA